MVIGVLPGNRVAAYEETEVGAAVMRVYSLRLVDAWPQAASDPCARTLARPRRDPPLGPAAG
jgi:hypothetical protein